jgi:2-oxoglutarate ferredoxin oxidoreductase subunit beta
MADMHSLRKKYLRILKTKFCPGCGHGIFINCFLKAVEELNADFHKMIFISGIGCAAWTPSPYFLAETFHTTHGRAPAFATGAKLAEPDNRVVIISGDGDLATIGGNHLIHSARRNLPSSIFCLDNYLYGMTGGQPGATTPQNTITPITPNGSQEKPFDLIKLVLAAGAEFASRWPIAFPHLLIKGIKNNLTSGNEKFAFTEVVSICPTHFGKKNGFESATEMLKEQKKKYIYISRKKIEKLASEEQAEKIKNKIVFGEFKNLKEYLDLSEKTKN